MNCVSWWLIPYQLLETMNYRLTWISPTWVGRFRHTGEQDLPNCKPSCNIVHLLLALLRTEYTFYFFPLAIINTLFQDRWTFGACNAFLLVIFELVCILKHEVAAIALR